ncbi:hypothetical protein COOONC_00607 [Cooperia oncophora]
MAYCNGIFKRMKPWGFLSLCVFLGLYGMNTALLALHFVYRYIAVCRQNLLNIFHNTSSIAAVIMSVFSWGLIYGFITFYCFAPNEHYYKYANQSVYETFGVDPHTISFFCVFTHVSYKQRFLRMLPNKFRQNLLNIFHNTSSIAAVIMSVFSWGLIYGFITFYCFAPNEHYYKYANQSVYETFGVDPHTISFFCVFTHEKKEGATIIHWPSTIGLCIVFVMMIITFTLMMVCGIKMHRTLKQSSMSPKARKLQNQMLKALALQVRINIGFFPFF